MNLLCKSKSLNIISLYNNKLESNSAIVIGDIVKNLTSLEELYMQNNNIKLVEMKYLVKKLEKCKKFCIFGISNNNFTMSSIESFKISYIPFVQLK